MLRPNNLTSTTTALPRYPPPNRPSTLPSTARSSVVYPQQNTLRLQTLSFPESRPVSGEESVW